jgi:RNA polymerase sigma-70 factor (ECF subfamily)
MYSLPLNYFAGRFLEERRQTEDIVQDAFVKLWQKRTDFESLISVRAFLYVTVRNQCLNILKHDLVERKYRSAFSLNGEMTDEDGMLLIAESEVIDNVYRALEKLPDGCRNVLELSYFKEMKNKEIASEMRVSVNTVKTQKKRGLHLLRAILKMTTLSLLLLAS